MATTWSERSSVTTGWNVNLNQQLWSVDILPWRELFFPWQTNYISTSYTERTEPSATSWSKRTSP